MAPLVTLLSTHKYPISLDLSADKIYTLSEESVKIAEAIDKDLEIVVFAAESEFSNPTMGAQNSLPEFDTAMKEFYSALHQYKSHSKDKLTYSFIDPNQEPAKFAAYNDYEVANGDILFLWVASIPLGILAGLVFHWSSFWIYTMLKIDQIIKCIWCYFRLRSRKWMKKIQAAN